MKFELDRTDGKARRGRLIFERGVVETPAFMPVGTYGTSRLTTLSMASKSRRRSVLVSDKLSDFVRSKVSIF